MAEFVANAEGYAKELMGDLRELKPAYSHDLETDREQEIER